MIEVVQDIEWINHIDNLYRVHSNNKNNKKFYYYPEIHFEIETENIDLCYRVMERKTQILFSDFYGRKAYLSDVDIINIIVHSKLEVYDVLCEILTQYIIHPTLEDVNFKINGQDFYYKSIVKSNYNEMNLNILRINSFETSADLYIKYIDLVTLISLIINKEYLVDITRGTDRVLRQAKKFYILSKFYRENLYLNELKSSGYNTTKSLEKVYYNNKVAKEIDRIFEEIGL